MTTSAATRVVGAIDQGTSSTRFILFDQETLQVVHRQRSSTSLVPRASQPGWAELCPRQIAASVMEAMEATAVQTHSGCIIEGKRWMLAFTHL